LFSCISHIYNGMTMALLKNSKIIEKLYLSDSLII